MQSNVIGTTMPVLEFTLGARTKPSSPKPGSFSWDGRLLIQMTTHTQMAGGGRFFRRDSPGSRRRKLVHDRVSRRWSGRRALAFAAKVPGHILPVPVGNGNEYLVHRHGFLCATPQVQLGEGFQQSLGAGIFGGDGFRLQHIGGAGTAWIELSGEVVTRDLRAGETLRVHPGHVGAFQTSVSFQIARIPGIRNMIFGGDGIFLAALTGPGRVWLQSLPISKLAHALMEYLPSGREQRTESGVVGGIVGSILGGMK